MNKCVNQVKTQLRILMAEDPDTQGFAPEYRDRLIDEFCEDLSGTLSPEAAAAQALSPRLQEGFYAAFKAWGEVRQHGARVEVRRAALGVSIIMDPETIIRVGKSDLDFSPTPDNVIKLR